MEKTDFLKRYLEYKSKTMPNSEVESLRRLIIDTNIFALILTTKPISNLVLRQLCYCGFVVWAAESPHYIHYCSSLRSGVFTQNLTNCMTASTGDRIIASRQSKISVTIRKWIEYDV